MGRSRQVLTPDLSPAHLWGARLRALRDARRLSLAGLSQRARYDTSYLSRLERGAQFPTLAVAEACDQALSAGGELVGLREAADHERRRVAREAGSPAAHAAAPGGEQDISAPELRLVALMSLHAVTYTYGEAGLRARFAIEAAQRLDPAGREQVEKALHLAAEMHALDRRQREPYINHLLRVALRILCHYGVDDPEVICAALLHDVVEDHADSLAAGGREEAFAALAGDFSPRVASLVSAVTNPEPELGLDRHAQYRAHVTQNLEHSPWARLVKVSDFTDNGVGVHHTSGPKAVKLANKYAPLVPVLSGLVSLPDTPLTPQVKAHILGQLCRAQERFAALTGPST